MGASEKRQEQTLCALDTASAASVASTSRAQGQAGATSVELSAPTEILATLHAEEDIVMGCRVRLHGLEKAADKNGKQGVCREWIVEKQRWRVELDSGELLDAKPVHLQIIEAPCVSAASDIIPSSASLQEVTTQPLSRVAHRECHNANRNNAGSDRVGGVTDLLEQFRQEPQQKDECAAKFALYEGYASEVKKMRKNLVCFCKETFPTLPRAIRADMKKTLKVVDTREAMSVPNDPTSWLVYHMMRRARQNNQAMTIILHEFEEKLRHLRESTQTDCPVCLERFASEGKNAAQTLSCCHKVCAECWEQWTAATNGRPFCPLCRHGKFMDEVSQRALSRA